jgi:hypothetical protein
MSAGVPAGPSQQSSSLLRQPSNVGNIIQQPSSSSSAILPRAAGDESASPAVLGAAGVINRSANDDWNDDLLYGTPDYSKITSSMSSGKERPVPFFDNSTVQTVSAAAGTTAVLQCKVRNLGQMAVSFSLIHLGFIYEYTKNV